MAIDAVGEFVRLCESGALDLPLPGSGHTVDRFDAFAAWGRTDLVLVRLAEGHADAAAIRTEVTGVGPPKPDERWGVWAAVPASVTATRVGTDWLLEGERPWCSGAGVCTHALVTALAPDGARLFAVDVRRPEVTALDGTWPAVGMARSDSRTVRFAHAPAEPVGEPDAYVARPGFWHGSAGVAACWYGGALGVADALWQAAQTKSLDPHAMAHLGAVDAAIAAAGALLRDTAAMIDADPARADPRPSRRLRATVEACAALVLDHVGRALGAKPLCLDAEHAMRVADLTVYLRQSHAERDLETLGNSLTDYREPPW
jgi:alkylation response protein AidB-like acyl-CoA dehydrogenase